MSDRSAFDPVVSAASSTPAALTCEPFAGGPFDRPDAIHARRVNWMSAISICIGAAILHFGSEVFLPLAIATLIAFALSPLISSLRRRGMPRMVAVLTAVTVTFGLIGLTLAVMGTQIGLVVQSLPTYQSNIITKLEAWTAAEGSSNVLGRFVEMIGVVALVWLET
ncbi:MAG: AI-2E family transporter [Rhodobacteraceae bacterium]|nr:AI-2E family transporter [Paracoccaceae bacterium]